MLHLSVSVTVCRRFNIDGCSGTLSFILQRFFAFFIDRKWPKKLIVATAIICHASILSFDINFTTATKITTNTAKTIIENKPPTRSMSFVNKPDSTPTNKKIREG